MKKNLLLVDDSLANVMLTMRALDDCEIEHSIVTASDGVEAYRLSSERHFDLLLLDIKMPRIDGLELLQMLRKRSGHLPAIVLSGSNLIADRERADALGAIEYVHKVLDYAEFRGNLKAALNRH